MRTKVLITLLLVTIAGYLAVANDTRNMEQDLMAEAESRIAALEKSAEGTEAEGTLFASTVTVTREYGLFGAPTAKVAIYTYDPHAAEELEEKVESGEEIDGHVHRPVTGLEYFFSKEGDDWNNTESGECGAESCQVDGRKAFTKSGIDIPKWVEPDWK